MMQQGMVLIPGLVLCVYIHLVLFVHIQQFKQKQVWSFYSGILSNHTAPDGSKVRVGFTFPPVIFGHIHIAKTAGTEINGVLAQRFERVCGVKGYSYDAISFNQRAEKDMNGTNGNWRQTLKTPDLISKTYKDYN
jgi:hypothetical protein